MLGRSETSAMTGTTAAANGLPACGGGTMVAAKPDVFFGNGDTVTPGNGLGDGGDEAGTSGSSAEPSYLTVLLPATTVEHPSVDIAEELTEEEKTKSVKGGKKERRGGWLRWRCRSAAATAGASENAGAVTANEAESSGQGSSLSTQEEDYIIPRPNIAGELTKCKLN
jgi:hypothetical protein